VRTALFPKKECPPVKAALSTKKDAPNEVSPMDAEDTEVSLKTCQIQISVCRNSVVANGS